MGSCSAPTFPPPLVTMAELVTALPLRMLPLCMPPELMPLFCPPAPAPLLSLFYEKGRVGMSSRRRSEAPLGAASPGTHHRRHDRGKVEALLLPHSHLAGPNGRRGPDDGRVVVHLLLSGLEADLTGHLGAVRTGKGRADGKAGVEVDGLVVALTGAAIRGAEGSRGHADALDVSSCGHLPICRLLVFLT